MCAIPSAASGGGGRKSACGASSKASASRRRRANASPISGRSIEPWSRSLAPSTVSTHSRSILVLDEPTARLPQSEAVKLIARLVALKERGLPIVYVTHRLDEVYKAADAVTVLRDGREAFSGPLSTLGGDDLRRLITGVGVRASRPAAASVARSRSPADAVVLEVDERQFAAAEASAA